MKSEDLKRLDEMHERATKGQHRACTLNNGKWIVKVYASTVAHFLPWEPWSESHFRAPDYDAMLYADLRNAYPALRQLAEIGLAVMKIDRIESELAGLVGECRDVALAMRFHAANDLRKLKAAYLKEKR